MSIIANLTWLRSSIPVGFAVVSIWEIVVKAQIGRLKLPGPAWAYMSTQRERHAVATLSLDEGAIA